jgi:hypothetical protein
MKSLLDGDKNEAPPTPVKHRQHYKDAAAPQSIRAYLGAVTWRFVDPDSGDVWWPVGDQEDTEKIMFGQLVYALRQGAGDTAQRSAAKRTAFSKLSPEC